MKRNIIRKLPIQVFSILILFQISLPSYALEYNINIVNCPSLLTFEIPEAFRPASSEYEKELEQAIINTHHLNKASKAKYSRVFMKDWSPEKLNKISFTSLGSLLKHQGKISITSWESLRDSNFNFNKSPYKELAQAKQEEYAKGAPTLLKLIKMGEIKEFVADHNKAVMLQSIDAMTNGKRKKAKAAVIYFYSKSCVATAYLVIDDKGSQSMDLLLGYIQRFNVID
ncbi:MAG: hypothetical protein GY820_07265 [Gammaproteobacteria bacterium]|nr:hypothetical protein [Gammaproteobacteria bacterium]